MEIGRNDPCPCGSGKKYKKCCFKRDQVERRVGEQRRQVEDVLDPDASIYRVWLEWRAARKLADFNFLYDLIEPGSDLARTVGDRSRFVADCSDGLARIPAGEPAAFRHLQIREGAEARLLQTLGDDDSASSEILCECIDLQKTDAGWRLTGCATASVKKTERERIGLDLFE